MHGCFEIQRFASSLDGRSSGARSVPSLYATDRRHYDVGRVLHARRAALAGSFCRSAWHSRCARIFHAVALFCVDVCVSRHADETKRVVVHQLRRRDAQHDQSESQRHILLVGNVFRRNGRGLSRPILAHRKRRTRCGHVESIGGNGRV